MSVRACRTCRVEATPGDLVRYSGRCARCGVPPARRSTSDLIGAYVALLMDTCEARGDGDDAWVEELKKQSDDLAAEIDRRFPLPKGGPWP